MNEYSINTALKVILKSLPAREKRNEKLEKAFQFISDFVDDPVGGSVDVGGLNNTLVRVSSYVQQFVDVFRCYRKIFQVIGRIVQG